MPRVDDKKLYDVLPSNDNGSFLTVASLSILYSKATSESVADSDIRKGLARLLKSGRAEQGVVNREVYGVKVPYPAFRKSGDSLNRDVSPDDFDGR